ncbi:MAG: hypothetical protein FWF04_02420 [Clostridiales bacterium]|nr:hypothetical protein [Clostridiales bacterium]
MTGKTMRFIAAIMIALMLTPAGAGLAWAKDTAQLDFADIAARVPKENKNMDILQRTLPMLLKYHSDMEKAQDSMKATNNAIRGLGDYYATILMDNQDIFSSEQKAWAGLMMQTLNISAASAGSISFNSINMQIEQMRIQIPQTETQLINGGQKLFITWHQLQDGIKKTRDGRVLLEENLRLAQTQQAAGLGTALAVKQAELAIFELDTGIKQMEGQSAQLLNQLKLIVGWPQEQIIKLVTIPQPNREFIAKIDINADIESARENSYSLKLKQSEYKHTDADNQKNLIKLSMDALKEQISLTVSTQYYKLLEAENTLLLEEQRLAVAEEKIRQSRLQHQLGLMADIELQNEESSYATRQDAVITARDSLFWEIENYKVIVAGLN